MGADTWLYGGPAAGLEPQPVMDMSTCLDKPCPTFARLQSVHQYSVFDLTKLPKKPCNFQSRLFDTAVQISYFAFVLHLYNEIM